MGEHNIWFVHIILSLILRILSHANAGFLMTSIFFVSAGSRPIENLSASF